MKTISHGLGKFPSIVWAVLWGTFFTRLTFFMIWPYLSLILYHRFNLSATDIGVILGLSATAGTVLSLWLGYLSDRYGRKPVMLTGGLVQVVGFILLAVASHLWAFIFASVLCGIGRSMLEIPGKALIADVVEDAKHREWAFHARFFMINAGAAIGPIVGLKMGLIGEQGGFWLTAVAYSIYMLVLWWMLRRWTLKKNPSGQPASAKPTGSFTATLKVIQNDHVLLLITLVNFIVMITYSQIDSTLLQYLLRVTQLDAATLFTYLLTTNAVTIVVMQIPLLWLMRKVAIAWRIKVALLLVGCGFASFGVLTEASMWAWMLVMVVLSLGEAIMFPSLAVQMDQIAPQHLKGSYFGAASLAGFGFAFGPVIGGLALDYIASGWLWYGFGVLQAVALYLYFVASRNATTGELNSGQ